jgi:hypothetical protein
VIARLNQVKEATDAEREIAWQRIPSAARNFGVDVPQSGWRHLADESSTGLIWAGPPAAKRPVAVPLHSADEENDQTNDEDRSKNAATNIHKFLQCLAVKIHLIMNKSALSGRWRT